MNPTPPATSASTLVCFANPTSRPAPFSGRAEDCNGFLLQCSLALEQQTQLYPTEKSKVSFIIQQLSGAALRWAETLWTQETTVTSSVQDFINHFKEVFGRPVEDSTVSDKLLQLRQGKRSVSEYSLEFRTLAAASGWDEKALLSVYRRGLNPALRLQLAIYDDAIGLEKFIQQTLRVHQRSQGCYQEVQQTAFIPHKNSFEVPSETTIEKMQVDTH